MVFGNEERFPSIQQIRLSPVWIFLGSALFTWLFAFPLASELRRRQLLDRPNERSSHTVATPRGGGIAIMLVITLLLGLVSVLERNIVSSALLLCALLLAAISFIDDVKDLPPSIRLFVQCLAAGIFLASIAFYKGLSIADINPSVLALGIASALWLVGYTNAFNFMDGINGIAAGQAFITGVGTALIGASALSSWSNPIVLAPLITAGAALGFLPHNFPHAKMFMGDVGSAPVGFLLASFTGAIVLIAGFSFLVPLLLLHTNYILDTAITLLRRIIRGEQFYKPHKEHFYQRLVRSGKSHTFATSLEMSLQLVTLALSLLYLRAGASVQSGLVATALLLWALFFVYAETLFNRAQKQSSHRSDNASLVTLGENKKPFSREGVSGRGTCNF
jgi:UDP-N-acetylmuramyl pentapeptide phosphotransferase/UDP-N-acetylglucosamine-1-phosphate transferase